MDELTAPQQNRLLAGLSNLLRRVEQDSGPEFLPRGLDVMGLVRQLALPSAETVEKMSYGDPLFRVPTQSNIPITTDRGYLAEVLGMLPAVPAASRATTRLSNEAADALVRQITRNPEATAPRVLEETAMPFMQAVAPKASAAFGTNDPYIYHLSDNKNIESFVSQGIKSSKDGMSGPGVYLARTPEETQYYSTLDTGTLYRVNKDQLIKDYGLFHYKNNPKGRVQFDETTGEILLDAKNIPPNYVEVKIKGNWTPLQVLKKQD